MSEKGKFLKLGVLDLVPVFGSRNDTYALERAAELAQTAERLGYSRYWVAEHHDMPQLACPSPEVLLAHIGARTKRIRIGSGAVLLPHYKPLKVAESFRLLAALYPGRIDLGIGRAPGGNAHASMALSGNFLENVGQMPDKLKDIARLLQGSYTYQGEPVGARPNPSVQPEVWLLGTNKKSAEYAAAFGMGYVFGQFMSETDPGEVLRAYRESFVPSPLSPKPKTMITIGVVCAATDEEARRLALSGGSMFREEVQAGQSMPYSERKLLVGTASSVQARLQELSDLYGVDEFMLVSMIPDYAERLRSYELLAQCTF
ncbi:LLM class flavin-dependent oxidoreductase [Paenibacillus sp. GD4]|uniref:LLM class flavin-dependent oxidoreductase n=1 Tax=Paenibacillus sp. GD4 TaxID=3068890 RepID=UPI002796C4A6|nr:LLM class flavin-dependent oxidoreductase [Paenibacillus sp. GD4]MDQ1909971.1 LLM class flavin-dependent oxidoreductase [Paenibacillus sp. GD4]